MSKKNSSGPTLATGRRNQPSAEACYVASCVHTGQLKGKVWIRHAMKQSAQVNNGLVAHTHSHNGSDIGGQSNVRPIWNANLSQCAKLQTRCSVPRENTEQLQQATQFCPGKTEPSPSRLSLELVTTVWSLTFDWRVYQPPWSTLGGELQNPILVWANQLQNSIPTCINSWFSFVSMVKSNFSLSISVSKSNSYLLVHRGF